jgi:hypothetical protein
MINEARNVQRQFAWNSGLIAKANTKIAVF